MREPENKNYKPIFQSRPITKTQKATAREITEGLRPIREGIENLPQAIKFPPIQLLGALKKAPKEASEEEASEEEASEEEASGVSPENLGEIAYSYLHKKTTIPS